MVKCMLCYDDISSYAITKCKEAYYNECIFNSCSVCLEIYNEKLKEYIKAHNYENVIVFAPHEYICELHIIEQIKEHFCDSFNSL